MFEVLVFVYENYWRSNACPEPRHLGRKLSAHGFDADEICEALHWLDGLSFATQGLRWTRDANERSATVNWQVTDGGDFVAPSDTMRVYSDSELAHLGAECLGFVRFMETAGALPVRLREIVIDRAMAAAGGPVALNELKIIIRMVLWSSGAEPDALVLDELCEDSGAPRMAH